MKIALIAAAVALAAPAAFAQSTVITDTTIMGAGPATVVVSANAPVSDFPFMRYQNSVIAGEPLLVAPVMASSSSTVVMGAPAAPVTRYWFNVPSDIGNRQDFRRWLGLM